MYHYNRALKKATQDAICKASLLSKNFGLNHIPTPYKIIENSSSLYAITYSSSTNYTASKNITPNTVKITAEIDVFEGVLESLKTVEVEFCSEEDAKNFEIPNWFGEEITYNKEYKNAYLSKLNNSFEKTK